MLNKLVAGDEVFSGDVKYVVLRDFYLGHPFSFAVRALVEFGFVRVV